MHCPSANANKREIEKRMLFDTVASAIMLTNNGEEQGLAANAKTIPTKKGNKNIPPVLLCGIFFTIAGKCISIIPIKFNPKINIIEAKASITIGGAIEVKALPDRAHTAPIMLSTRDSPIENDINCRKSFFPLSFEYPPIYPIIRGNIPRLQGDNEAIRPAIKLKTIASGTKYEFV